jgi:hypothetical protein|tara:strand:+ start:1103 stop:1591 length:489 start_codon:yes stop_codon:yes gene_type:complete
MEMKNMSEVNNTEIEAFLAEVEQEQQANMGGNRNYVSRDTLKLPISEETGYSEMVKSSIIEGYTEGIEGQYGVSTAVRLVEPTEGRRQTLWLTGYEQEHLKNFIQNSLDDGASYPFEVQFVRHKVEGRNGRKYNRFSAKLLSSGEDVVVPPVPADQLEPADA